MTLLRVLTYRACAGIRFFGCLCVLLAAFGCAHIDLSEGTGEEVPPAPADSVSAGEGSEGGESYESEQIDFSQVISVDEALAADSIGCEVTVFGYYVGYVNGKSLVSEDLVLNFPAKKPNVNLLLADRFTSSACDLLLPVELGTTTELSSALNVHDHPELLRKRLLIRGTLGKYLGARGLRNVTAWRLIDKAGPEDTDGAGEITPGASDEPDSPDDNDNTGTTGGGTGEEVERVAFPTIVESRSAKIAK